MDFEMEKIIMIIVHIKNDAIVLKPHLDIPMNAMWLV